MRRGNLNSSRFLLASLHLQSLKDRISIRKVKEALTQLPRGSGLAASKIAYDETMNRIRGQEKGFCDLAIATLAWITLAMTPLTLRELQCALSVEPGDTAMDEADFVDEETLSSVCAGLIVVDRESQIVRLAHYTTQEYFENQMDVLFPDEENLLAKTCLTYLSFDEFSNWQWEECPPQSRYSRPPSSLAAPDDIETFSHNYPLLSYASNHWYDHARPSQDPTIQGLVIEYLKRTENLAALLCPAGLYDEYDDYEDVLDLLSTQSLHGLPLAAKYGFTGAVKALLDLEGCCAEDRSRIKTQALSLAAFHRQSSAVRILLDGNTIAPAAVSHALSFMYTTNMYDPNIAPPGGCEVAEILLKHGAEPNTVLDDVPLIHYACWSNDAQLASVLLSHGADVELRDVYGRTAVHQVAQAGHFGDIVEVLLEHQSDINARDDDGKTALLIAVKYSSTGGHNEYRSLVTQLLECGASVDQWDMGGWTALHYAADSGAVWIACQLLEASADANDRNRDGKTAAACLNEWKWGSMTEEERANCEEILEKYSFYQSEEKRAVSDSGDDDLID